MATQSAPTTMSSISDATDVATPLTSDAGASQVHEAEPGQLPQHSDADNKDEPEHQARLKDGSDDSDDSDTAERAKMNHVAHQLRTTRKKRSDRVEDLEKQFKKMDSKWETIFTRVSQLHSQVNGVGGIIDFDDGTQEPNSRLVKCRLNPQFWKKFQEAPLQKVAYPIDVLVGDPELPKSRRRFSQYASVELDEEDEKEDEEQPEHPDDTDADLVEELKGDAQNQFQQMRGSAMPERIRLSIFALQYLLKKILDAKTGIPHGYSSKGVIMLRPYKPFFHGEDALRSRLSALVKAFDILERQRRRSSSEELTAEKIQTDKKTEALSVVIELIDLKRILERQDLVCCEECTELLHGNFPTTEAAKDIIACFLGFIDAYLKPIHDSHRQRKTPRVAFNDLWHLFKPGDEIIMKPKDSIDDEHSWHATLLRVLRVQGGRPHVYSRDNAPYISGIHPPTPSRLPPPPPPPGTLVREPIPPRPKAINGIIPFTVDAYYLDFNGHRITPMRRRFFIEPYTGDKDVRDLEVYPHEFALKSEAQLHKSSLVIRGGRFADYVWPKASRAASHVECQGVELKTQDDLNEQLLIDMREYWKLNSAIRPIYIAPEELDIAETNDCFLPNGCQEGPDCRHRRTLVWSDQYIDKDHMDEHVEKHGFFQVSSLMQPKQRPELSEDDLAIFTYRLFAWGLHSRKWVEVHVDSLSEVRRIREDMGFDKLVLQPEHKQIIHAQVKEHFRKKTSLANKGDHNLDIVRGKGQGLIILLHGAPGVGKTATAECIADLVVRPLYPITCGDLGSTAAEVETELSRHFDLASRWDCVMLLDEADVFLAKRSRQDHERNAIVSVFLRMLEYYKGILFLTTNRIGTFDEAFKSRIHISLFYPNFNEKDTIKVWKTFIKQTKKSNPNIHLDKKGIEKFAKEHYRRNTDSSRWNGRQIRNAFHTAIAMAEYQAREKKVNANDPLEYANYSGQIRVELGREQFDVISSTVRQFDDYIKETMGTSYEDRMEHEQIRKTKFKSREKKSKKNKSKGRHGSSLDSSDSSESSDSSSNENKDRKFPRRKDGSTSGSSSDEKAKKKKSPKKAKDSLESSSSSDSD